jgi:hypothetical protein
VVALRRTLPVAVLQHAAQIGYITAAYSTAVTNRTITRSPRGWRGADQT